jgi:DNA-binding NarL/FixJ family response regulator
MARRAVWFPGSGTTAHGRLRPIPSHDRGERLVDAGETDPPTRVFVLDGHRVFAEALADVLDLQPEISVVGLATDVRTAHDHLAGTPVDILIVDPATLAGVRWQEIRAVAGGATIAIVSDGSADVGDVAADGVRAWFGKSQVLSSLLDALPKLRTGWAYFPPNRLGAELNGLTRRIAELEESIQLFSALTPREREVLGALMDGKSRAVIAEELHLTEGTVRAHIEHVKSKLGVSSPLAAIAVARRLGWRRLLPGHAVAA